jgi:hypothetical protein
LYRPTQLIFVMPVTSSVRASSPLTNVVSAAVTKV